MAHFEIRCLFIPFPTLTPPSLDPGLTSNIPNEKVSLFRAISSEKLCGIWLTTGQCLNSGTWATTILSTMTRILSLRTAWSFADGRITLTFMSSVGLSTVSLGTRSSTQMRMSLFSRLSSVKTLGAGDNCESDVVVTQAVPCNRMTQIPVQS